MESSSQAAQNNAKSHRTSAPLTTLVSQQNNMCYYITKTAQELDEESQI